MKSPILFLFLAIAFSSSAFAQSTSRTNLAFQPGSSENSGVAALGRGRIVSDGHDLHSPFSSAAGNLERKVFSLLNDVRRTKGLEVLEWNDDVAAVARLHSQNMADENFFSHRGSDGSMVDDRADRLGLGAWRVIGENIAYMRGYDDPATLAVEKWMESTAHRNNLLGPNWKQSAVGISITKDGTYYMTQVFLLRK